MENKDVESFAQKVITNMGCKAEPKYGIDPITIILVISVILTLIRVIQECRKKRVEKTDLCEIIGSESIFGRWRVQRAIKKHLSSKQYKEYGTALIDSLKEVSLTLTDEEVSNIMGSVE